MIRLEENAYQKFVNYYNNHIEKMLLGEMSVCRDWGGKYHGLILRIAGILHCAKCALDCVDPSEAGIKIDVLSSAIEIGEYYMKQAIFAYSTGDIDLRAVKAEKLLDKLRANYVNQIKQSELYLLARGNIFKSSAEINEALSLLEELGYVRRQKIPAANGNPKSVTLILVNPLSYSII